MVKVIRSGDVIPKIVGRFIENGDSDDFIEFKMPNECPMCGSPTERVLLSDSGVPSTSSSSSSSSSSSTTTTTTTTTNQGVAIRCTGGLCCSAQAIGGLDHFCSREAVDIKGLGIKSIEELHSIGMLKSPADIYRLKKTNEQQTDPTLKLVKLY